MMTQNRKWLLSLALLIVGQSIPHRAFARPVYGGEEVLPGTMKYSYVVALKANSSIVCSGIAVGDRWVLTAAHCAALVERIVPFGASQATAVSRIFCHPGYVQSEADHLNAKNDLALLKTETPIGGSWQRQNVAPTNSTNLLIFGWGKTSPHEPSSNTLRKSRPVERQDEKDASGVPKCDKFWKAKGQVIDANEFCAGDSASSGCKGDSGGPLFNATTSAVGSELEPENLVGILSKADDNCDTSGIFEIYTAIDAPWMEKVVNGDTVVQGQSACP